MRNLAANEREMRELKREDSRLFAQFAAWFFREHLPSRKCQLVKRAQIQSGRPFAASIKEPDHVYDGWSARHTLV